MGGGRTYGGGSSGGIVARRARGKTDRSEYEALANEYVKGRLKGTERRDHGETKQIIDQVVDALNEKTQGKATAVYGGSTAKGTFVEGISDHDVIVRVQETTLGKKGPRDAIHELAKIVKEQFPDAEVSERKMTATFKIRGKEIQILPALMTDKKNMRVPVPGANEWSHTTQPKKFARRLTDLNQRYDGMIKQTIRNFKLLQEKNLPAKQRLQGYHVEALAYVAFHSKEPTDATHTRMLEDMTRAASHLVRRPIVDQAGQSRHVDDYLGGENSKERQEVAHHFSNLAKRMRRARDTNNVDAWKEII